MMLQQCEISHLSFMMPFTWRMWVSFLLLWIFYSLNLSFISFLSKKVTDCSKQEEEKFSLSQSFRFFSIVSLQYGVDKCPRSISGKMLMCSWSYFMLIVLATYTANLTAFFTQGHVGKPLESVNDILESNYSASTYSYLENFLQENTIFRNLSQSNRLQYDVESDSGVSDWRIVAQIKERLQSKKIVFDFDTHVEVMKNYVPGVYALDGHISRLGLGFAMRNDWQWSSHVKKLFINFGRAGFFDEVERKYEKKKSKKINETTPIDVDDFFVVLIIMSSAATVASFLMVITFLHQYVLTALRKKRQTGGPKISANLN